MRFTHLKHIVCAGLLVAVTGTLQAQNTPHPYGGAGSRPVAILLCQYPDSTNTYSLKPADMLASWMTNTLTVNGATVDNSINGLVQEASEGTVNFKGTKAFGWYTLPNPTTYYQAIPTYPSVTAPAVAIGADCMAAAQKSGVNFTPFTYVAMYLNDSMPAAAGVTWTSNLPTTSPTTWNTLIVSLMGLFSPPLVLHELGHMLSSGGQHTDSGSDPLGAASWYGYPASPSSVSPGWDASRRELMGFIPSVATFAGGMQTYNISRLTQPYTNLPEAIDVPLPNGAKYVISARTLVGHDALDVLTVPNQYGWDGGSAMGNEGVKIELFTSPTVDAHIVPSSPLSSPFDAGNVWLAGQTYTDSANGITITVNSFNATANPTAQITVSSGLSGNYKLIPQNASGMCLDVYGAGSSPGTNVDIWSCNGNSNQSFNFVNQGNGIYQIQPSYATGLCLDVAGGGNSSPGTKVDVWTCNGGSNQQWKVISDGGNIYEFAPQNVPGFRLDVLGGATGNGTQVDAYPATNGSNQKWMLTK